MYVRAYLAALVAFLVIDIAWIGLVVIDFYRDTLGGLMSETPGLGAAAVFYLAYVAGIVFLAVRPAVEARSIRPALVNGLVLGALSYGTYTVTNFSILENWTAALVVSDIAWGSFLTAVCGACGYLAARTRDGG